MHSSGDPARRRLEWDKVVRVGSLSTSNGVMDERTAPPSEARGSGNAYEYLLLVSGMRTYYPNFGVRETRRRGAPPRCWPIEVC